MYTSSYGHHLSSKYSGKSNLESVFLKFAKMGGNLEGLLNEDSEVKKEEEGVREGDGTETEK